MAFKGSAETAQQRRCLNPNSGCWATRTIILYGVVMFLVFGTENLNPVSAHKVTPDLDSLPSQNKTGICASVDIRNSLDTFKSLTGCQVIEGFVRILLFDNADENELSKISFPELTEITDYLLLFRVNGLRSIGQLFPNLSVIRGQTTFFNNYAFVIFEMSSLQEIGLHSLTDITQGTVLIDKNPSLCFAHSIDWTRIVHDKTAISFIKSLKPENECPICPGDEEGKSDDSKDISCPKALKNNFDGYEKDKHLCWNRQQCQRICPSNCTSCNKNLECCDSRCIGGCSDDDVKKCTVCRYYSMGFGNDRQCMEKCPSGYYQYLQRRCVKREECIRMEKPSALQTTTNIEEFPYKIFNDTCLLDCPANYMDDYEKRTCKPCGGRCKKECPGVNIDSISLAKQLRGCTHITGSLEIQIRGGSNVVTELEENLSMIEEIYGYLKIVRSFSLVSLHFLKSLKRIRGNNLESHRYAFVLLDNQNLQDLWDWKNRTLKIDNGSLFIHYNPKLCLNKIRDLQKEAKMENITELEVARNSNGDKIACNVTELDVNITKIGNKYVLLEWKPFFMDDDRKLLAYTIYSIKAPSKNVTLYDGRDACGQDNWHVDDVSHNDVKVSYILTNLEPYTQYAFYVKTYTVATEQRGALSPIMYFRTKPDTPSSPIALTVVSFSSDSLNVTWRPPASPNGNITHYFVSGKKHASSIMDTKDRNYCKDPPKQLVSHVTPPTPSPKNESCCSCEGNKPTRTSINEMEEQARIKFEDELHNQVYVKRVEDIDEDNFDDTVKNDTMLVQRRKRETGSKFTLNNTGLQNVTENGTDIWESFSFPVYGKTDFFIQNLHHFTFYDIYVQACREREEKDESSSCSATSISTARTEMKQGADDIKKIRITNQSLETVTITWDLPEDPNGMILSFTIEYGKTEIKNAKPNHECITLKDFKNNSGTYTITKLSPGNYSLRVRATSSHGNGEYSPYVYFDISETTPEMILIVLPVVITFVFLLCTGYCMYRKHIKERDSMRLIPSVNPEYVPSVYVPDEWEVPRKNIELLNELGQGSFGMVWEGIAHDIRGKLSIPCAVKTVNEHATNRERLEFLNEASVMKAFDTAHVVRLLGVVSQGQPTLVIMELMANGDLKTYLRSHRPDADSFNPSTPKHPPSLRQILQMAIEIADGMAYLAAKKFVHRDLAARNCMVSEMLTVKIGDFGMTRDIYETDYYRKGTKGLLPVRWMAPESLKDGVFTSSSDVWSYGVVLWEMATLSSQPYQGLSNDQVLRYVIDGGVMERPENCPDKLYTLMRYCWQHKPSSRPTFIKLCQLLLEDASPTFAQVSFYHSPAGYEARQARPAPSPCEDDPLTPLRKAPVERIDGYTPSESQESDDIDIDTHHQFPSISESTGVTTTANGYVGGCPTNGTASIQC